MLLAFLPSHRGQKAELASDAVSGVLCFRYDVYSCVRAVLVFAIVMPFGWLIPANWVFHPHRLIRHRTASCKQAVHLADNCLFVYCVGERVECWDWTAAAEDDLLWPSYWPLPRIGEWPVIPAGSHWETALRLSMEQSSLTQALPAPGASQRVQATPHIVIGAVHLMSAAHAYAFNNVLHVGIIFSKEITEQQSCLQLMSHCCRVAVSVHRTVIMHHTFLCSH